MGGLVEGKSWRGFMNEVVETDVSGLRSGVAIVSRKALRFRVGGGVVQVAEADGSGIQIRTGVISGETLFGGGAVVQSGRRLDIGVWLTSSWVPRALVRETGVANCGRDAVGRIIKHEVFWSTDRVAGCMSMSSVTGSGSSWRTSSAAGPVRGWVTVLVVERPGSPVGTGLAVSNLNRITGTRSTMGLVGGGVMVPPT